MARLRQRQDGDWYIRIYAGDAQRTGEGFFGTWQVHAAGMDRLRRMGICNDGDFIPRQTFFDLVKEKLIWKGGSTRPMPASRAAPDLSRGNLYPARRPSVSGRKPNWTLLRLPEDDPRRIPVDVRLELAGPSWSLRFDVNSSIDFDLSWLQPSQRRGFELWIDNDRYRIPLKTPDALLNLKQTSPPFEDALNVVLVEKRGAQPWPFHAGTIQPTDRKGTLFDRDGFRMQPWERIEPARGTTRWSTPPALLAAQPIPDSLTCNIRECHRRDGWTVIGFNIRRQTQEVTQYLYRIGCELR
jgi:hypothetical protein